jgi:hypothetical protein
MDSIRSAKNHKYLVEEIRKRAVAVNKKNRKIELTRVKAHAAISSLSSLSYERSKASSKSSSPHSAI